MSWGAITHRAWLELQHHFTRHFIHILLQQRWHLFLGGLPLTADTGFVYLALPSGQLPRFPPRSSFHMCPVNTAHICWPSTEGFCDGAMNCHSLLNVAALSFRVSQRHGLGMWAEVSAGKAAAKSSLDSEMDFGHLLLAQGVSAGHAPAWPKSL